MTVGEAILSDPQGRRQRTLDDIARVREREPDREIVRTAAVLAVIGHHRLRRAGREVLDEIKQALGVV